MPCHKRTFPCEEHAHNAMRRMWARKIGPGHLPCRAYHCPECGRWHLTSKPSQDWVNHEK